MIVQFFTKQQRNLCMVSGSRLVCVDAPFRVPGTYIFQEEWEVVFGASCAVGVTGYVALSSTRWIQIGPHVNWTGGCGRLISSEVKQGNRLWRQQTHYLQKRLLLPQLVVSIEALQEI